MKKETFTRYDTADYLKTKKQINAYLEAAAEENDPAFMLRALETVARAKNMSELSRKSGISRKGIYKALGEGGNPSYATVAKIADSLGVRIHMSM